MNVIVGYSQEGLSVVVEYEYINGINVCISASTHTNLFHQPFVPDEVLLVIKRLFLCALRSPTTMGSAREQGGSHMVSTIIFSWCVLGWEKCEFAG